METKAKLIDFTGPLNEETALAALKAAHEMVSALCHGERKWVMRIPAEPTYDPDLVIGAGLRAGDAAMREVERLNDRVNDLEALEEEYLGILERIGAWICVGCRGNDAEPGIYWKGPQESKVDVGDSAEQPRYLCCECSNWAADIEPGE